MGKIPDTAQVILWGALACGGILITMLAGAYENQDSPWSMPGVCFGLVALLVGGCGLLGVCIEGTIRWLRDLWHENDEPVRRHRRRR